MGDHNAQPCRGIELQLHAGSLHQGFDHHRFTGIRLLRTVVVVLNQDHGMVWRQRMGEPALKPLDCWQALTVLGVKGYL